MPKTLSKKLQPQIKHPIAHFLIGIPGSGKSTFAKLLSQQGNCEIISTDDIRAELYGDAAIQGDWKQIETVAIERIYNACKIGKNIIYDATNFKRAHRLDFLEKVKQKLQLNPLNIGESNSNYPIWIGWYLQTPLETSIAWNQMRSRLVPEAVIHSMHETLKNFPPITAEGFTLLCPIDVTSPQFSVAEIDKSLGKLQRSIINTQNRYASITLHQYSHFLDFERLLHLISLILKYPGIGNLQNTDPNLLTKILGYQPNFSSHIQEIIAIITKEHGSVYAREPAIVNDLQYLAKVGIIAPDEFSSLPQEILLEHRYRNSKNPFSLSWRNEKSVFSTKETGFFSPTSQYGIDAQENRDDVTTIPLQNLNLHSYADQTAFDRLIGTIRLIIHRPFLNNIYENHQITLVQALEEAGVIYNAENELDTIRKDIEKILKPYQILPSFPMRNGYFAGTGILSQQELIRVFEILQSQAKNLDDPLAIDFYNTFKQRMVQSRFLNPDENIYPIRSISNHSIVDEKYLHETSLLKQLIFLETAIMNGTLLELSRFRSSAKYEGDARSFILIYPLQIVFHNLAWYLGYECVSGEEEPGLLRFERLDRLFLGNTQNQSRIRSEQEKALKNLQKLVQGSAGIFLGNSVIDQHKFLSPYKKTRSQVCVNVELWFNDSTYRFITEGTKRFANIKMSRPKFTGKVNLPKSIFCWDEGTGDINFPNRFQATLTKWSLQDFDLWRWIIGFGGNVKVIHPPELVEKIKKMGQDIANNYL
ncbi:MAG: WYL domain-containing protein [Scytonema sp. PMC 1069.18]|nr:WYL domain-containing protein [Scytonema sp. PMC 1069.18]MEC4887057.1 WYL domain-containing protein [Scytonema sp. PMC 1070.18]